MKKLSVLVLALVILFGVSQTAHAHSNLLPAVKVGGGWVSVVSYVDTMNPIVGVDWIHSTYQVKNPANLTDICIHEDGASETTPNDLTTTVLAVTGGGVGTVFPATDTVGSALIAPPIVAGDPTSEGFLVLENFDSALNLGADGTLTSEAIVFNLASGFLYSERALTTTHIAASPGGNVSIEAPGCGNCNYMQATPRSAGLATALGNGTAGTLTRFMFLPPATASTGVYAIAVNRPNTAEATDAANTVNLVAPNYSARIRLNGKMDANQGYALGVYNRLEDYRSTTVENDVVCLAQLTPGQLVGAGIATFIADGGWTNLSPICLEIEGGVLQVCNANAAGAEQGDAAVLIKVEYASGYGYAITPMNQQWYAK